MSRSSFLNKEYEQKSYYNKYSCGHILEDFYLCNDEDRFFIYYMCIKNSRIDIIEELFNVVDKRMSKRMISYCISNNVPKECIRYLIDLFDERQSKL